MIKKFKGLSALNSQSLSDFPSTFISTALITALLVGCGGGSGDSAKQGEGEPSALSAIQEDAFDLPADTITKMGSVFIGNINFRNDPNLSDLGVMTFGYAEFIDYKKTMSQEYIDMALSAYKTEQCNVIVDSSDDAQDINVEENVIAVAQEINSESVGAGEVLSVLTPAGSWSEFHLDEYYEDPTYELQTSLTELSELPSGSYVSIPGGEFPAFDKVSIPTAEPLSGGALLNANDGWLSPETQLTWATQSSANDNSVVSVYLRSEVSDEINGGNTSIEIACTTPDDGEFTFPFEVTDLLTQYDISTDNLVLIRTSYAVDVRGDAAVFVSNSSTVYF